VQQNVTSLCTEYRDGKLISAGEVAKSSSAGTERAKEPKPIPVSIPEEREGYRGKQGKGYGKRGVHRSSKTKARFFPGPNGSPMKSEKRFTVVVVERKKKQVVGLPARP